MFDARLADADPPGFAGASVPDPFDRFGGLESILMAEDRVAEVRELPRDASAPKIRWDDSNLRSSYANVVNVTSTREEVVLLFGLNNAWQAGQSEVTIQLSDRLILSPFAAKRLSLLLDNVLKQYEARFGTLNLETRAQDVKTSGNA